LKHALSKPSNRTVSKTIIAAITAVRPLSRRLAPPLPAEKQTARRQASRNYGAPPPPKFLRRATACSNYRFNRQVNNDGSSYNGVLQDIGSLYCT